MEYNPPIESRTTEALIDIVVREDEWQPQAVEVAKQELLSRGVSSQTIVAAKERQINKERQIERIERAKRTASYTVVEQILMILFFPISLIIFQDIPFFNNEGYKKKNTQGCICFIISLILWGTVLYMMSKY